MREKLIEIVFKSLCNHIHKSCKLSENIADDLIANDVVPVVRCKDCFYNDKICPASFSDREDDDYCSIGRRDDPWAKKG